MEAITLLTPAFVLNCVGGLFEWVISSASVFEGEEQIDNQPGDDEPADLVDPVVSLVLLYALIVPYLRFVEDKRPESGCVYVFRERTRDFGDSYFDSPAAESEHVYNRS
jgi:hypothetical protein